MAIFQKSRAQQLVLRTLSLQVLKNKFKWPLAVIEQDLATVQQLRGDGIALGSPDGFYVWLGSSF